MMASQSFATAMIYSGYSLPPKKRELCLVHNTIIIGGSRLDPGVTWVALLGTAVTAIPIKINEQESLKQVSFLAPPWDELLEACASTAAFAALTPSVNNVKVKLRGMVCIPSLLAEAEMNWTPKKPVDQAIAFVTEMSAHDALPSHAPTADKALVHLRYEVQFCWAAQKSCSRRSATQWDPMAK
jgi:hypothetical protein